MPWQLVAIWIITASAVLYFVLDEIAARRRRMQQEALVLVRVEDVERLRRLRLRSIGY